ncbi:hypothetical protein [Acaryochloris sp. IP29b_bin.137]|uniref:hypothetical protein n=1 Tax=Acaryochloris sp. IP29b_bin.137 TaxID=2969217 RepID=UPI0026172828|nr:hypothetical protein [Acaryochloris sp. IP29b_bin.137]
MRIWLISFLVLMAVARGLDWLHHLSLPLPILLLGGAILSIVSNESALGGLPWMPQSASTQITDKSNTAIADKRLTPQ